MDVNPPNWHWIGERDARLGKPKQGMIFPDKASCRAYIDGYKVGKKRGLDHVAIHYKPASAGNR